MPPHHPPLRRHPLLHTGAVPASGMDPSGAEREAGSPFHSTLMQPKGGGSHRPQHRQPKSTTRPCGGGEWTSWPQSNYATKYAPPPPLSSPVLTVARWTRALVPLTGTGGSDAAAMADPAGSWGQGGRRLSPSEGNLSPAESPRSAASPNTADGRAVMCCWAGETSNASQAHLRVPVVGGGPLPAPAGPNTWPYDKLMLLAPPRRAGAAGNRAGALASPSPSAQHIPHSCTRHCASLPVPLGTTAVRQQKTDTFGGGGVRTP